MGNESELSVKVGQRAEARSFLEGFRGAWFRCEILQVGKCKDGVERLLLKYYDFDDDTPEWLKLYKRPAWKSKYTKELMLRPPYPPIYNAKKMPDASENSQASVIVDGSWKVGDLVDWYTTSCFWCGTITKLLGDAKAELQLPKQPDGEGLVYEIELKDVRPSLDWSPEHGWTMPKPTQEGESGRPSAWLLKPINQGAGGPQIVDTPNLGEETEAGKGAAASSSRPVSEEAKSPGKRGREHLGSASSSENIPVRGSTLYSTGSASSENAPVRGSTLRSTGSDTLEAAVMDLEEYVNKVKWLRKFLMRSMSLPEAPHEYEWEFLEPQVAASGNIPQAKGDR